MFSDMAPSSGTSPKTYPYNKNIRPPKSLHMGTDGSLPQLGRNMGGLVDYVEVLITGKGASSTGRPLGNKFFMKTGTKCKDEKTKKDVPRYMYINNVPDGGIPMMPSVMGINMTSFRGLIPGAISNMEALDPMALMKAFTTSSTPACRAVTRETIDVNNRIGTETQFVANVDIKEGLTGMAEAGGAPTLPRDATVQLYFAFLGLLVIYMMYRLMVRGKK